MTEGTNATPRKLKLLVDKKLLQKQLAPVPYLRLVHPVIE